MRAQTLHVFLATVLVSGCAGSRRASAPPASCRSEGINADSAYLAHQAMSALGGDTSGIPLKVDSFQPINVSQIEMGVLISVVVSDASRLGEGGLVWVDVETACPIVLKRYE